MSGMYAIVGFNEIVCESFPPHSTKGYPRHHHYHPAGFNIQDRISGAGPSTEEYAAELVAGDMYSGDMVAGDLIAGLDLAQQLLAVAGLGGPIASGVSRNASSGAASRARERDAPSYMRGSAADH